MIQKVHISHRTVYNFSGIVALGPHLLRMIPQAFSKTLIENYKLTIEPNNIHKSEQQDIFGNRLNRIIFYEKTAKLEVHVEFDVELPEINPFDFFTENSANNYPFEYDRDLDKYLNPYFELTDDSIYLLDWLKSKKPILPTNTIELVTSINSLIYKEIGYLTRDQAGVQEPSFTIKQCSGSCRDSSWLLIQLFRSLHIAARFVSGYLIDLHATEIEKDNVALHAWVEVYLPGAGWVGMDPTSGMLLGANYIPLCATPHYNFAYPITGNTEKTETTLTFSQKITRF